nr:IS3 family transposase [Ectobacillus funiculus]
MAHQYSIQLLCDLAQVSRSGYYKWLQRQTYLSPKQIEGQKIKERIKEYHAKLKGIYGYRRVMVWLRRRHGLQLNHHKRVQRLMRSSGRNAPTMARKKCMSFHKII